jgi:hypothetical protein
MGQDTTNRRWYDFRGDIVELDADVPLTMYDGLNHEIVVWEGDVLAQMVTKCGKRACPTPSSGLREVPGRGPVDCPDCLGLTELIVDVFAEFLHQEGARDRPKDFAGELIQRLYDEGFKIGRWPS